MKKLYLIILLSFLFDLSFQTFAQYDYFHGQKNVFGLHINANPRFKHIFGNSEILNSQYYQSGTYYRKYDSNDDLVLKEQKMNILFNMFYGRMARKRLLIGLDFSYQHFNLTTNKNIIESKPNYISPAFHAIDAQFSFGLFLGKAIAPNKHLLQFQLGPRLYYLNSSRKYNYLEKKHYEGLNSFIVDYKKPFTYIRFSLNYTYRIFLAERLKLDLGISSNFGWYGTIHPIFYIIDGDFDYYDFNDDSRGYIKNKLGVETVRNMFYLKIGVSYDF